MNPRTTLTMANGLGIDLLDPHAEDIDFKVIGEHLAKDNRYCGATRGLCYSVAEHSVRCADAALLATEDAELAAYLLIHDGHEAFFGDDTTPKKWALGQIAAANFGVLAEEITSAFELLIDRMDIAIHEAAGLTWPPSVAHVAAIKRWDKILLATEWRDLMRCEAPYEFGVQPLPDIIDPLDWIDAGYEFNRRCEMLLPHLRKQAKPHVADLLSSCRGHPS